MNVEIVAFETRLDALEKRVMKARLEIITNVAVLLVALVVLGNFAWVHLTKQPVPRADGGLRKGDTFSLLPGVDYRKSARTLVIALSSKCEHCNESLLFFKQLLETNAGKSEGTQVVAIFPETREEVSRYIFEQHLTVNAIPGIDYRAVNLLGTPSVVLISNEGKILNFWVGKPSRDAEKEIMDSVTNKT